MESRWRPNVTVAAYIEGRGAQAGSLLWVRERISDGRIVFNNAAGHLESDETPLEAVCREVLEETGCPFTPTALLGLYLSEPRQEPDGRVTRFLRIAYLGTVGPRERQQLDAPILETLWLRPADIRARASELRSALLLRGLDDYEAGRRFPLELIRAEP